MTSVDKKPLHDSNWMSIRSTRTTDAFEQASGEGLTSFIVTERCGKQVILDDGKLYTEFISCSYLGLESHPLLIEAAYQALHHVGIHLSASRSAMSPVYLPQLENLLQEIYQGNSVTVFTSTSNAHLGVLPLLGSGNMHLYPTKSAVRWLVDKTAHASMQVLRGLLGQFGQVVRVDTHDTESLTTTLKQCQLDRVTPILLIDGVGSMSGLLPVRALAELLNQYEGYLYVDDAHGISISGKYGAGYAFENLEHCLPNNTLIAGSLSKAFGGAGGFIVLRKDYNNEQLKALANPLVFGHTVPVPLQAANVAAAKIHLSSEIDELQTALWKNIDRFDEKVESIMMNAGQRAPIRGAYFASEQQGLSAAATLRESGLIMFPVFYPIVETNKAMLRFAISANHSQEQIDFLATKLNALSG
ncbi:MULTISPECIES: aminotransferase class I/II-fold pyridoxal phosphate-dependent enzyme [Photobacterium]|uniref:Aminotransferase n=1 Tax=Photobacterium halotolerans TaxID=265726 RepID=A0A0F5VHQ7_9GAMM|nr:MULTISPECIES: aminotransferase class I/II-fold pyridoxal phosphate-dependent enzyme [Photobacterium]KKD01634.1 aminotransferase [Photobacterium halotolerans]UIP27409.1 aminotransferase class I/II-fold pyridoxal phosphate-dependent enzyme [Photobacterium sp. TLY01]